MHTRLANRIVLTAVVVGLTSVMPAFAQAGTSGGTKTKKATAGATETIEAGVATYAWYWRDQQQQKVTGPDGTDIATLELKNPYCPDTSPAGSPPEEACHPGRLPIEVRNGDYARPHKLSAVNLDLMLIPPGSEIFKLEVTLWEARDDQSRSTQFNVDGHRLQACEIVDVFGEGEARLYKERPEYKCTDKDATATRDTVKIGKGDKQKTLHRWRFDLTKQAQEWMKKQVFFTSVMLTPAEPRDPTPQDQAWQVVLAGPLEKKYGVDTEVVYEPGELLPPPPPPDNPPFDDGAGFEDDGFDDTSTSSDFGASSTTTTTGSDVPVDTTAAETEDAATGEEDAAETAEPTAAGGPALASDRESVPAGLPLYVWLAIIAGMIGFSMVRSVVLEKNSGIRPDGVLAQIQRLNAQRRGTTLASADAGSSPFASIVAGLGALGTKITGGAGKLAALVSRKKG